MSITCPIEQAITAIEERITALEARVSYLASSLVRLDMLLSRLPKEISQPDPASDLGISSVMRKAISRLSESQPEIDLNAAVPEGSTIIMDSAAAGSGAANYRLQTLRAMMTPIPPETLCNTPCFCVHQVVSEDYGNTCPKSIVTCPFNKACK